MKEKMASMTMSDAPSIQKNIASYANPWSESCLASMIFINVLNVVKLLVFLVCSGNPFHARVQLETSYWLNFFTKAGIPAGDSAHYAVMFTDNRITREMLLDLSKEYLTDMGITRLGDVIAILKHAKDVYKQEAKDKLLMPSTLMSLTSLSSLSSTPMSLRRSTAASRMVNHFTSKHPEAAPMSQSPSPKPPPSDLPRPKRKVSVFQRLGTDTDDTVTLSTGNKLPAFQVSSSPGSVFSRLGGKSGLKRTASNASLEDVSKLSDTHEESLPYAGVLKSSGALPVKQTNFKVALNRSSLKEPQKIKKTIKKVNVEEKKSAYIQRPEVSTTTEGVLSDFAKKEAPSVKERLGSKPEVSSVTSSSRLTNPVKKQKLTIQDRLGVKREDQQSSSIVSSTQNVTTKLKKVKEATQAALPTSALKSSGVFSRLGKKPNT